MGEQMAKIRVHELAKGPSRSTGRSTGDDGEAVSASRVRQGLASGDLDAVARLVPRHAGPPPLARFPLVIAVRSRECASKWTAVAARLGRRTPSSGCLGRGTADRGDLDRGGQFGAEIRRTVAEQLDRLGVTEGLISVQDKARWTS